MTALKVFFSNVVFWLKCRAGFRLLRGDASVSGTVTAIEIAEDGDTCFDITVDSKYTAVLTYVTSGAVHTCNILHCEIVPADRARLAKEIAKLVPGRHVTVTGKRAWDGCHHGRGNIFDALMVLLGAAPVVDGWIEIHPVTSLHVE